VINKIFFTTLFLLTIALPSYGRQYKVLRVIDGDTIDINYKGQKERITLLAVNTPESVHPDRSKNTVMGRKASKFTKSRLANKYCISRNRNQEKGQVWPSAGLCYP